MFWVSIHVMGLRSFRGRSSTQPPLRLWARYNAARLFPTIKFLSARSHKTSSSSFLNQHRPTRISCFPTFSLRLSVRFWTQLGLCASTPVFQIRTTFSSLSPIEIKNSFTALPHFPHRSTEAPLIILSLHTTTASTSSISLLPLYLPIC